MTAPRAYFSVRRCWPAYEGAPPLPACVRWLASPSDELVKLPAGAVGCLVWAFEHGDDEIRAVQLEALGADGSRLDAWPNAAGAKRKGHGPISGAWLKLPRPGADTLVLVEGPTDALAAHWLHPAATVWCCGGGLRLQPADLDGVEEVFIEADADTVGKRKADKIGWILKKGGIRVKIGERRRGDVADVLKERIEDVYEERAAIMEYDGELPREKAEAEAIRIAWKMLFELDSPCQNVQESP